MSFVLGGDYPSSEGGMASTKSLLIDDRAFRLRDAERSFAILFCS